MATERAALPAGDYGVRDEEGIILAAVERKSLENLATTLSDGTLAFQMQRLAELPSPLWWWRDGIRRSWPLHTYRELGSVTS